jgi:nitrile hydratase
MGGMEGLGPLQPDTDGPAFGQAWEARVLALTLASPSSATPDNGRYRMECIPAADYLRMSYYEKWLAALAARLVENGVVTAEELAGGQPAPGAAVFMPKLAPEAVEAALGHLRPYSRELSAPAKFAAGDAVRARTIHPRGHTRLPRYVRGRPGLVVRSHGAHVFPDSNAHGLGESPQPLYTVRFEARDLWGDDAEPRDAVYLDLWESYLERR